MEESYMNVLASSVIYENPLPQLRSRQSAFPFLCELPGGMLLASHAIGEAFESVDGTTYLSRSEDGGRTWNDDAVCMDFPSGDVTCYEQRLCQLASGTIVCIGWNEDTATGARLLALHAVRRDTDRPGIYGCIVDFSEKTWRIEEKALVWEPVTPMLKNEKMAEIFSFLKFGQPGAIRLADGDVLMSHWCAEDGQYKTVATRIAL